MAYNLEKYEELAEKNYYRHMGKVVKIVGLTIESVGPNAKLSDLCRIIIDKNKDISIMAEVVGFRDKRLLLMPYESGRAWRRMYRREYGTSFVCLCGK